jgi:hypothetical protein
VGDVERVLFIDESGAPGRGGSSTRTTVSGLAFCVGVLVRWQTLAELASAHKRLVEQWFRPGLRELKGATFSNDLAKGVQPGAALNHLAQLVKETGLRACPKTSPLM